MLIGMNFHDDIDNIILDSDDAKALLTELFTNHLSTIIQKPLEHTEIRIINSFLTSREKPNTHNKMQSIPALSKEIET